jgi:hypothetical protein
MEILRTITLYADAKELPFLLIGGHAVNAYGIQRQTGDIDLIVRRSQHEGWAELFAKLNYQSIQYDSNFLRYKPDTVAAWPVDLMLVDDQTFTKLYNDSREVDMGVVTVKAASPRHLATLKIHALKHFLEHRFAKDYNDLLQLLRGECRDISADDLRELCIRYAHEELYHKISKDLGGS